MKRPMIIVLMHVRASKSPRVMIIKVRSVATTNMALYHHCWPFGIIPEYGVNWIFTGVHVIFKNGAPCSNNGGVPVPIQVTMKFPCTLGVYGTTYSVAQNPLNKC